MSQESPIFSAFIDTSLSIKKLIIYFKKEAIIRCGNDFQIMVYSPKKWIINNVIATKNIVSID